MAGDLEDLEKDLTYGLELVAKALQERYLEFQPYLKVDEEDIILKLEELSKKVDDKLCIANNFIRDNSGTDASNEIDRPTMTTKDGVLRKKLCELSDLHELLDKVQTVENLLISCRSDPLNKVATAQNLIECEELLNDITKDDGWPILTGRIRDTLREEVIFMVESLKYSLICAFDEFVSYPTIEVQDTVHMRIRNEDPASVGQILFSLDLLGELDRRLKNWAAVIVKNFVHPVVHSENGMDPLEKFSDLNGTSEFVGTSKINSTLHCTSLDYLVSGLSRLFSRLATSIERIQVDNRPLSLLLGGLLQEDVMTVFLKCIANTLPLFDPGESKFKGAMQIAEKFREDMISLGFFNDATPTFQVYCDKHLPVFVDRRCLEVLKKAKELICLPYLMLAEVGTGEEVDEETVLQFREGFDTILVKTANISDFTYPVLLRLPRCKVSQSTVSLVELMFSTLRDAVNTDSEMLCARLTLTVRNILQLFMIMAPHHHGTAISSMPQMAAVFYNNCYYICHRLMLMPFSILKDVDRNSAKYANFRPLLSDSLWKLREIAADMLEKTMRQCRRDISVMLAKDNLFGGIDDPERYDEAKDVLKACLMHVQNVAHVFKDVLTEMVYSHAMANITSFLLNHIGDVIMRMEDIRSVDADQSSTMIDALLIQLEPIFMVDGRSSIHESCSTAYFRIKEILFCLKGSLQGIDDRWCNGKGPLAQWLKAHEVRSLVKALFMNTEQRRRLLDSIY